MIVNRTLSQVLFLHVAYYYRLDTSLSICTFVIVLYLLFLSLQLTMNNLLHGERAKPGPNITSNAQYFQGGGHCYWH